MRSVNKLPPEFERILSDMNQGFGRGKSTTAPHAPAGSGRQTDSASAIRSCTGVMVIALILAFLFAMTWLILTHV